MSKRFGALVASVVLVVTACSAGEDGSADAASVDAGALAAELAVVTEEWLAASGAPGVTLTIVGPDGLEITEVAGVSDLRAAEPVTSSDFWRFGSITKPMTSAVVLALAEEGLVDLDAPVAAYLGSGWAAGYALDGVDYGDTLTVAQMLNHTAGFAEFAFDPGFYAQVAGRLDQPLEPEEIVAWAVERGPQSVPGTDYEYTTVGHVVAGLVIEQVTGRPAAEVLEEYVFAPAGAADAYLPPTGSPAAGVVNGYVGGILAEAIAALPALASLEGGARVGELLDISVAPQEVLTTAGWTGGGIEAQSDDIARIMRVIFNGTVLNADSVATFTDPVPGENYGLGIGVGDIDGYTTYSHGGGVPGFRSDALYIPELDIAVAASSNLVPLDPSSEVGSLTRRVAQLVIAAVGAARVGA